MDFQALIKASQQVDIGQAFQDEAKSGGFERDTRYLKIRRNSDNEAKIRMRFLPYMNGAGLPFVKVYERSFKYDNKWFIENCLSTLDGEDKDPANDFYFKLWDKNKETGDDMYKAVAKNLRRNERYISLVYVISDAMDTPEETNAGKIFLFKYGPQIYKMLEEAPKTEDEHGPKDSINPFSIGPDGADFSLIQKPKEEDNPPSYEKSKFLSPKAMFDGDNEAVQNALDMNSERYWDIKEEIAADKFKKPSELESRLYDIFGDLYYDVMGDDAVSKRPSKGDGEEPKEKPKPKKDTKETGGFDIDDEVPFEGNDEPVEDEKPEKDTTPAEDNEIDDLDDFFNS